MGAFTSLNEPLYEYLLASQPREHTLLRELRTTTAIMSEAYMLLAPEQAHLLAFLTRLISARQVLEVGTFTGYSALALALALPSDGRITTCDVNSDWIDIGRRFWKEAGVSEKIEVRIGPARATLQNLIEAAQQRFDLVFIDADKENYDCYYEHALKLVRVGGLVVLDNMFQRGRTIDLNDNQRRTICIRELNTKIASDERADRVLLPIGDGMTLVRRRV